MGLKDLFGGGRKKEQLRERAREVFLYGDGLRIGRTVGNTILRFKSKWDGTAEIVGELPSALMR